MAEEDTKEDEEGEAIRVFVRVRPLNKREVEQNSKIFWNFNETSMIEETQNGQRLYAYDAVFGMTSENQIVYNIVGKPIVLKAMEGFNGTVFTYGQTGSGKTWTMRGSPSDPGMMILCIRDILDWTTSHTDVTYKLTVAYMEVYNEEINDLLGNGEESKNLKIVSEDNVRGAVIGNLNEDVVHTHEDFLEVLRKGEANRSYASTSMNADSSRSHVIYRVTIEVYEKEEPTTNNLGFSMPKKQAEPIRISYLNLVDLAGSERQKSTNASGKTLKEGANINKSLLALGAVINKLGEASGKKKKKGEKEAFIPYRDSKLTRILKQSLGGNTMTSILCAASPADINREETVSTLKFGQLCKTIKNSAKSNEIIDDKTLMKNLKAEVAKLKEENEELKAGSGGGGGELITKLKNEKKDLEERVQTLEAMMMNDSGSSSGSGGSSSSTDPTSSDAADGDATKVTPKKILPPSMNSSMSLYASLKEAKDALNASNEKLSECQRRLIPLEKEASAYKNFEATKAEFEEYEVHKRQEFDEEKAKIDADKNNISIEKYKLLSKEQHLDEKESKIVLLLATLDEQDSKLRQLMSTMKDQQANLTRSVSDLQRREELVEEWQRSHRQREMKLHEYKNSLDERYNELTSRDNSLVETEHKWLMRERDFSEREQRLQVALSRLANSEQQQAKNEENLAKMELAYKKREHECDIKERELQVRRREMESLDSLLREKDRKISMEQRMLDEREDSVRSKEDKFRHREMDVERKVQECKLSEAKTQDLIESYNAKNAEMETREKLLKNKSIKIQRIEEELTSKENELSIWETSLQQLQEKMQGIEERENELIAQIEKHKIVEYEFFNVKVAAITARHSQEIGDLQQIIDQQTQIVLNFQKELEKAKDEINIKSREYNGLLEIIHNSESEHNKLKEELHYLTNNMKKANDSHIINDIDNDQSILHTSVNLVQSETMGQSFILKSHLLGNAINYRSNSNNTNNLSHNVKYYRDSSVFSDSEDENSDSDDNFVSDDIDEVKFGGDDSYNKNLKKSRRQSKYFMEQMLEFQKILFNILKKYRMLPDKNEPLLAVRQNFHRRSSAASPSPQVSAESGNINNNNNSNRRPSAIMPTLGNTNGNGFPASSTSAFGYVSNGSGEIESSSTNESAGGIYSVLKSPKVAQDTINSNGVNYSEEFHQEKSNASNIDYFLMPQKYGESKKFNNANSRSWGDSEMNEEKIAEKSPFLRVMIERSHQLHNVDDQGNSESAATQQQNSGLQTSTVTSINGENGINIASIVSDKANSVGPESARKNSESEVIDSNNHSKFSNYAKQPDDFQLSGSKQKVIDLSKSMHDPPGSSRNSPGRRSPLSKHINKVKQDNQNIKDNPDIIDFVEKGRRGGLPVARIALDMGGTKKIVKYINKNE